METLITRENTSENDPFKRRGRVVRSPPTMDGKAVAMRQDAPVAVGTMSKGPEVDLVEMSTPEQGERLSTQLSGSSSPRLELIYKMRSFEEESVVRCRAILRNMKHAILRQKNVSNDIKDGVSELAEQFDVMERYRKSWKAAEEERRESQAKMEAEARKVIETVTPLTTGKRAASSPAENTPGGGKKMREKEPQVWQVVQKKRGKKLPPEGGEILKENKNISRRRLRTRRIKPEAVLIKPAEGNSYADVLKNLRTKIQPEEAVKVKGIRKTRTGALLLEFNRGEKIQTEFVKKLRSTVQKEDLVTELKPLATLEIRDLDSLTVKEEVEQAVKNMLESSDEALRVRVTTPNGREQVRAFVTLSAENAAILLRLGKIRIGWIQATIRPWLSAKRCFRCLCTGHVRVDCKGPNRENLCFRCGEPGHKVSDCVKPARCCLCADAGRDRVDHFPGSKGCPEFRPPIA